jgi:2-methylcitrate dehydratase PrpD
MEGGRGFYQAFAGTVEQAELAVKDLGKRFLIMEARYKPYPVCWLMQTPIELSLELSRQYHVRAEDIVEITARLSYADATHAGSDEPGPFVNATAPLLSTQFGTAAAFLGKPVKSFQFYYEHYGDAEVGALAKKVKVVGEKDRVTPKIEVRLRNGKEYSVERDTREDLVPTDEKIQAKFSGHVSQIIGKGRAQEIIRIVSNLDKVHSVLELTEKLW